MTHIWCKINRSYQSFWYKPVENEDKTLSLHECLQSRPLRPKRATVNDKKINILAVLLVPTIFYWFYFRNNNVQQPYINSYPMEIVVEPPNLQTFNTITLETKKNTDISITVNTENTFINEIIQVKANKPPCVVTHVKHGLSKKRIKIDRNYTFDDMRIIHGGYYKPTDCEPRYAVGILVPYRERKETLDIFINNIHPFLIRQKLEYRIFIVEQSGAEPFNRGKLLNAGFLEMMKIGHWDCVIFHDVDLLPNNDRISYACPKFPRHLSTNVIGVNKRRSPYSLFGGVTAMSVRDFKLINGFSNLYWGLGGEDNDMFWRLRAAGRKVIKINSNFGTYECIGHTPHTLNPNRFLLISTATERYKKDGLSSIEYNVITYQIRQYYSHIVLDLYKRNISNLSYN